MWIVASEQTRNGPEYLIKDKETGEVNGKFDCEPWAQGKADELNRAQEETVEITIDEQEQMLLQLQAEQADRGKPKDRMPL